MAARTPIPSRPRWRPLALLSLVALAPSVPAGGLFERLQAQAGEQLIRAQAGSTFRALDAYSGEKGIRPVAATRVVPGFSLGRKTFVGAYLIVGELEAVRRVKVVFEVTGQVEGGAGGFAHLIPSSDSNPLRISRVNGVGIVASVESTLWDKVGTYPIGGNAESRPLRALAALAAGRLLAPSLNAFLNRVHEHPSDQPARVVPILTVGEKSYVGMAQVLGPGASTTDAVLLIEEDLGFRLKVRFFVPVDGGLELRRQRDVGVGTLINVTLKAGTQLPGVALEKLKQLLGI